MRITITWGNGADSLHGRWKCRGHGEAHHPQRAQGIFRASSLL